MDRKVALKVFCLRSARDRERVPLVDADVRKIEKNEVPSFEFETHSVFPDDRSCGAFMIGAQRRGTNNRRGLAAAAESNKAVEQPQTNRIHEYIHMYVLFKIANTTTRGRANKWRV